MFDKKSVIVQLWSADVNVKEIDIFKVSVWVRLLDLELKYWGNNIFMKLVSGLGKLIKTDRVMVMQELFSYVRIMVEIFIDKEFSEYISSENKQGVIYYVLFYYEWKFIKCIKYDMYGYGIDDCKQGQLKKIWRVK